VSRIQALLLPLLALAAAPAGASAPSEYRAELAAPAPADRIVVRDTVWHCAGDSCVAAAGNSRPAIACAALAKTAGALRSFSVEGRAIATAELEKCNARAR
jgi:hypothetical protein